MRVEDRATFIGKLQAKRTSRSKAVRLAAASCKKTITDEMEVI